MSQLCLKFRPFSPLLQDGHDHLCDFGVGVPGEQSQRARDIPDGVIRLVVRRRVGLEQFDEEIVRGRVAEMSEKEEEEGVVC